LITSLITLPKMIHIFDMKQFFSKKIGKYLAVVVLFAWPAAAADLAGLGPSGDDGLDGNTHCVNLTAVIAGLERTDESWLRDYLDLGRIEINSQEDIERLRTKILTTDIFSSADVRLEMLSENSCRVSISISEKWTRIPVIRGVYGGGTPLLIAGGYETNAFGRLLALGGEVRRYGNRPPGGFLFFKSPRAWQGRGLWGGELWLDRRRRSFYEDSGAMYGFADSESLTAKFQFLYPVMQFASVGSLQAGLQFQASRESPSSFSAQDKPGNKQLVAPRGLHLNKNAGYGGMLGGIIAVDGLGVQGLNMQGLKGRALWGRSRSPDEAGTFSETEWFGYWLLPSDVNMAAHLLLGSTTDHTLGGLYYLGGFDSIRGLPDGIHFGNKIAYANFEARIIAARFKYAHIQPAVFMDTGSAWIHGDSPAGGRETSVGGGVRISIPQVFRLILRVDYGVSLGTTKSRGMSVGLNQFFQPYKLFF